MHRVAAVVLLCLGLAVAVPAHAQGTGVATPEGASGLAAPRVRTAPSDPAAVPPYAPPAAPAAPAPSPPPGDGLPPAYAGQALTYPSPGYGAQPGYGGYGVQPGYGGYGVQPGYGGYGVQPGYPAPPYSAQANDPRQLARTGRMLRRERILAGISAVGAGMMLVSIPIIVRECHMGLTACSSSSDTAVALTNGGLLLGISGAVAGVVPGFRVSRQLQRMGLAPRRGMVLGALVSSITGFGTPIAPLLLFLHARSARRALDGVVAATQPRTATFSLVPYVDARSGASGLRLGGTF